MTHKIRNAMLINLEMGKNDKPTLFGIKTQGAMFNHKTTVWYKSVVDEKVSQKKLLIK